MQDEQRNRSQRIRNYELRGLENLNGVDDLQRVVQVVLE